MLVKELRQGIQSGAFAWTFIGLQAVMFLIMAWMLALAGDGSAMQLREFNALAWVAVGIAMAVVVPLRGLGAISAERAGSNLDLVRLTHLSATRIVTGKWLALVSQSLLLAAAVLPYLVLRYFFGGFDVFRELEVFAWLAGAAMLVAAIAVALSTLPLWLRIAAGVACVVPVVGALDDGSVFLFGPRGLGDPLFVRLGVAALIAVYVVACLEFAAGRIAPAAENHAARKRLLALGIAAAWIAVATLGSDDASRATMLTTGPLVACFCVGALVERPTRLVTVVAPFARRGLPGRLAARLFAPGWATGLLFVAVAWCLFTTGFHVFRDRHVSGDPLVTWTMPCLLAATLVFPLPLVVYLPRARMPLLLYALAQLVCFMVFVWSGAFMPASRSWHESSAWVTVLPFPLAALLTFGGLQDDAIMAEYAMPFLNAALFGLAVTLAAVAVPWVREQRALGALLAATRRGRDA
ncbi:MAG: hypothetical protein ACKOSQ_06185 [Planctomycetaceae bacterium]